MPDGIGASSSENTTKVPASLCNVWLRRLNSFDFSVFRKLITLTTGNANGRPGWFDFGWLSEMNLADYELVCEMAPNTNLAAPDCGDKEPL